MKNEIMNCFALYASRISETVQYTNWSDEFCRDEVKKSTMDFLSAIRKYIDFSNITKEDAIMLGFKRWDKESDLYLIPLYLLPVIPVGAELTCIDREKTIYDGTNIDNDSRFGCIAWGIIIE